MAFAYTESTNIVVATAGTSGTPLAFIDFVTADRAGTDTDLLVAGSPASNLALTYAVRPVEDLAILVKCIVANKSAEADFIFITGTDWRGAAQTESIDVTAGNGSYTSTKYWATITTLDCSDNAAGGGTVWADGDLGVTQDVWGVIWDYGNGYQYQVDADFEIGDGSTSTYFTSLDDHVYFDDAYRFKVTASAILTLGELTSDLPSRGAVWSWKSTLATWEAMGDTNSVVNLYGSTLQYRYGGNNPQFKGTFKARNSLIISTPVSGQTYRGQLALGYSEVGVLDIDDLFIATFRIVYFQPSSVTGISKLKIHNTQQAAIDFSATTSTITNADITAYITDDVRAHAATGTLIDPVNNISHPAIRHAAGIIKESYSCNIHVSDKDGANLSGVSAACEDQNTDAAFTTQTTAADGTITEQTINYKQWAGTSETLTTYSPHKFTISKAGYETLILEAITVDGPINWHLELQAQKQPPAPWQEGMM